MGRSLRLGALGGALVAGLLCGGVALASPRPAAARHATLTARNRAIMADFAHRFYDLRDVRGAFERHVAPDYIQHNPNILDGREAAIAALEPKFSGKGAHFDVKRIVVDGDLAVIHLHGRTDPANAGGTVADIYRLSHGKIVEHWDVLQIVPGQPKNSNGMF